MTMTMMMRVAHRRSALSLHHARCLTSSSSSSSSSSSAQPVQRVALDRLAHQSKLHLQISDRARTNVEIIPVLSPSEFALNVFGGDHGSSSQCDVFSVAQEEEGSSVGGGADAAVKSVRITKKDAAPTADDAAPTTVQLHLPHLIDLNISVVNGNVTIQDKIEGDVKIVVGEGDIMVNKLRGEDISMKTNKGSVDIASLLEGEQVKIAANAVTCKRLMSGVTEIKLGKGDSDSEVSAIYSSACVINSLSKGGIQVGNVHGYLRVVGEEMRQVHVHSVNGAIDLEDSGKHCDVVAHFDSWSSDVSSSILVGGNVVVSVEPATSIEVELHGNKIATDGCDFSESELDQLDVDYAIFSGALQAKSAPSATAGTSGKINVGSAKNAAMRTSFFMSDDAQDSRSSTATRETVPHPAHLPRLLVHATSGSVKLEQLDWMAKLKRKHLKQ